MKKIFDMRKILMQLIISAICVSGFGQSAVDTSRPASEIVDSLKKAGFIFTPVQDTPSIELTTGQAVEFLEKYFQQHFWQNVDDPLRQAIEYLLFLATRQPYNSSEAFLKNYKFDSIKIPWEEFYIWDTLKFRIPDTKSMVDSSSFETDAINTIVESDSAAVFQTELYDVFSETTRLKDTLILVITDTLTRVNISNPDLPFRYYNSLFQVDSLEIAVNSLIKYLEDRDSTIINITGRGGGVIPIWFNSKSNNLTRYWLKNEVNDSITVWVGSTERNTVGLYVEEGVNFRRPMRLTVDNTEARVNVERQDRSTLIELQRNNIKKSYWRHKTETNLLFNQIGMSNWVKGGEKSFQALFDITGFADYDNKAKKVSSNNFIRLKLGGIASGENPLRKNTDIFESNSKLNHKAFGKFDFSAVMTFKTQLLKGYNYPKDKTLDPVLVSKILNPASFTVGLGLDYKPNARTSINFSPLAYKLTFVTDTVNIDQTKHGIPKDKQSFHEPGVSFIVSNIWRPAKLKNTSLTNRLQLFSNYIDKPQNIDIDWEATFATRLNWFTELKINTHLIFSDNIKTPVLDKDKNPVLNDDGTQKKTARIQFKEIIGISLVFVF